MSSLGSRVLVAIIGVPVLVWVVLWSPSIVVLIALALLAGIGAMELQQCVGGEKRSELNGISAVVAVFTVCWYYERPEHISMLLLIEAVVVFGYAIVKGGEVKFDQIMAALFGSFAIGYSFASFLRLMTFCPHRAWLLLPFILSFACDTFAYFVGCTIGKHKLAPKVSPKKSIEGSVGGLIGNVLCGHLFVFVMLKLGGGTWEGGMIDVGFLLLTVVCGVVAQIGDLSFSLIKREFGIKDYGKLFLAHGGVLDRFDSVLFVAPTVEVFLRYVL